MISAPPGGGFVPQGNGFSQGGPPGGGYKRDLEGGGSVGSGGHGGGGSVGGYEDRDPKRMRY